MDVNLIPLLPATQVLLTALVVMLLDLFIKEPEKGLLAWISLLGLALGAGETVLLWGSQESAFGDTLLLDNFALFFAQIFLGVAALTILSSIHYVRQTKIHEGEFYELILFATVGMILMAAANDLIIFFLGLETMSIAVYVLTGLWRASSQSSEAAMKYFLLGAFATGFLLYGIALIYGATGSTNFDRIAAAAARPRDTLITIGLGLLLVGFGFKISSVPFHMWAPDVYEGAPTSVTALIATGSKAAAFAALIRVLTVALKAAQPDWSVLLWAIAVVSMTAGNVIAIAQSNLKRMLAYSSIAHVGYMLVGLVAGGVPGAGAVLFYLLAYTFTTAGAFGAILLVERSDGEAVEVGDYAGLARRHPVLAATLGLFLLSLVGIPPLAGFVGKFYLFGSAVRAGYLWLTVIGVLNSAIAAYYYLRVIVYMYMREPEGVEVRLVPSFAGGVALAIALVGIVLLGVMPAPFADLAQVAVAPLLR